MPARRPRFMCQAPRVSCPLPLSSHAPEFELRQPPHEWPELLIRLCRQLWPLGLGVELGGDEPEQQVQVVDAQSIGHDVEACRSRHAGVPRRHPSADILSLERRTLAFDSGSPALAFWRQRQLIDSVTQLFPAYLARTRLVPRSRVVRSPMTPSGRWCAGCFCQANIERVG